MMFILVKNDTKFKFFFLHFPPPQMTLSKFSPTSLTESLESIDPGAEMRYSRSKLRVTY